MRANTRVSILRGERVETEFLDVQETMRRISVGNPASIQNVGQSSNVDQERSNTLSAACRVSARVDVKVGDRVFDERREETYTVDVVTRTRLTNQGLLLNLTRLP